MILAVSFLILVLPVQRTMHNDLTLEVIPYNSELLLS
jgi:hypothetical protein